MSECLSDVSEQLERISVSLLSKSMRMRVTEIELCGHEDSELLLKFLSE